MRERRHHAPPLALGLLPPCGLNDVVRRSGPGPVVFDRASVAGALEASGDEIPRLFVLQARRGAQWPTGGIF